MSEANGTSNSTPKTATETFIALEDAEWAVNRARGLLATAQTAERQARERVVGLLARVGGPIGWGHRVYTPTYASAAGRVIDFHVTEFVLATEIGPVVPTPDTALATAARDFALAPEPPADEPPPFGVEPWPTVRPGRPLEAAVFDDDGEG